MRGNQIFEIPYDELKDACMIENVFLLENFHGIDVFLSIYEPQKKNIVFIGPDPALNSFLSAIIPHDQITGVRRIGLEPHNFSHFRRQLPSIISARMKDHHISNCGTNTKVYTRSIWIDFHLFVLVEKLKDRGCQIKYIPHLNIDYREITDLSYKKKFLLWLYTLATGLKLAYFQCHHSKVTFMGLAKGYPEISWDNKLTWSEIRKKYNWDLELETDNAVLIVDGPIQNYAGIKINKTQKNLIEYFQRIIQNGREIHLKPHYGSPTHSFQGTEFESKIKVLPDYFPVELILDKYQTLFSFTSSSFSVPLKAKKYSLVKLLEFDSMKIKQGFIDQTQFTFEREYEKIQFIEQ